MAFLGCHTKSRLIGHGVAVEEAINVPLMPAEYAVPHLNTGRRGGRSSDEQSPAERQWRAARTGGYNGDRQRQFCRPYRARLQNRGTGLPIAEFSSVVA